MGKKKAHNSKKRSEKKLLKLIKKNRNTEYGKKYDFASIKTMKDYQDKVPLTKYKDYSEYINRMARNKERNLITYKNIKSYALTSGTTSRSKLEPHDIFSAIPFF